MNRRRAALVAAILLAGGAVAVWPRATKTPTPTATPAAAGTPRPREAQRDRSAAPIRLVPGSAERAEADAVAVIEGKVVDSQTGGGVSEAQIVFFHDGLAVTVSALGDGSFRLLPPESGDYRLDAITAAGYRSYAASRSQVVLRSRPGVRIHDVLLFLDPVGPTLALQGSPPPEADDQEGEDAGLGRGRLRGVVRGATAFSIVLWQQRGAMERGATLTRAFFDAEGRFEIDRLDAGEYRVMALARDAAPSQEARVTISETAVAEVELRLRAGGRLFGQVIDGTSRRPIAGARVELEGLIGDGDSAVPLLGSSFSGQDGSFSLRGLGRGPFSIVANAEAHHGRVVSGLDVAEGGQLGPLTIDLTPTEPGEKPRLELVGVGAVLQGQGDALIIVRVMPEGGAAEAGLGGGDSILAIDGVTVTDLGFQQAIERIRGPEGSTVVLRVRRSGNVSDVPVRRRRLRS